MSILYKHVMDEARDLGPGNTIKINHVDCSAGEDTRKRLYLTRPAHSPKIVLAYCHNCGKGRAFKKGHSAYRDHDERMAVRTGGFATRLPKTVTYTIEEWPAHAIRFLNLKVPHIEDFTRVTYQIGYDPVTDSICTPIFNGEDGYTTGYQLRPLADRRGAKYTTTLLEGHENDPMCSVLVHGEVDSSDTTIIVEDYLSAVALIQAVPSGDFKVIALHGVRVDPLVIDKATDNLIVWLDNDSDHVKQVAKDICRVHKLIKNKPGQMICTATQEPKALPQKAISNAINFKTVEA